MKNSNHCPDLTAQKDEIKAKFSDKKLAYYIAEKLDEVVTPVNGKYSIGKKAGGGSISVFTGDDGFAAANDFAGSGVKGDCLAVIEHFEGCSFDQALKIAADMVGCEPIRVMHEKPIRERKADPSKAKKYDDFMSNHKEQLRSGLSSENAKKIAENRSLDPDKLDCFDNFGFTDKEIKYTCLGTIPANSFVFWNDEAKTIKRVRFDIETGNRGDDKEKDYSQFGGNCHFSPRTICDGDDVYLVEGEFDAIALAQSMVKAIAVKPEGNGNELIAKLAKSHRIILAYDNDGDEKEPKGHGYTEDALKIVPGAIDISRGFDDGADPNDFVAKHGANSVQALIELVEHENLMNKPVQASSSPADGNASLVLASEEQKLQPAINAMYSCRKPVLQKDGSTKLEFERGDIAPICAFLKARGVYKELFTLDNGLRTANGDELTSEVLTGEQLIRQAHGLPAMGVCAPRLCMQAARFVCEQNQKDSLRQFVDDLPVWDGIDRISEFWQTYAGALASDEKERQYLRGVSRYMFTAIIGRALATREKPCKADMAIILEGNTGIGKTTLVKALCARKEWYKTLSLDLQEDEYKRALRMTQIVEIGEMGEPNNKQLQAIKRILSSELLSMRKKGVDDFFYFPVRAFTIATIDQTDVLNDGAGARRWLPIKANGVVKDEDGHLFIDCDGIKRDLLQLYAQGKAIYEECGVVWNEIDKEVQKAHTDSLTVADERASKIILWMRTHKKQSAKLDEIAIDCLGFTCERWGMREQKELARALKLSGFEKKAMWFAGKTEKRWTHPEIETSGYSNDEFFD